MSKFKNINGRKTVQDRSKTKTHLYLFCHLSEFYHGLNIKLANFKTYDLFLFLIFNFFFILLHNYMILNFWPLALLSGDNKGNFYLHL